MKPSALYLPSVALFILVLSQPAAASWPGDAGRIVFQGKRDGHSVLLTMSPAGRRVRRVTDLHRSEASGGFSPDGRRIVFVRSFKGNQYDISTIQVDGSHLERLTFRDARDLDPSWSPDGKQIVYSREGAIRGTFDLFAMDSDGSNKTQITSTEEREFHPFWSPDGDSIAYIQGNTGLCTIDADGSNRSVVARWAQEADWSPDGDSFVVEGNGPDGAGIYSVDEVGAVVTPVLLEAGWFNPIWAPSGDKIAALKFFGDGELGIYVMNPDGSERKLIRPTSVIAPFSWQAR